MHHVHRLNLLNKVINVSDVLIVINVDFNLVILSFFYSFILQFLLTFHKILLIIYCTSSRVFNIC